MNKMKTRLTNQKLKIWEYLRGVKIHPTSKVVYDNVKKEIPTISLATVYRNLNQLVDNGEIKRLEINNEFHFDEDISNHQHCICKKCGKIQDQFQKEISKYALDKVNNNGFFTQDVQIIFYGNCKKCEV